MIRSESSESVSEPLRGPANAIMPVMADFGFLPNATVLILPQLRIVVCVSVCVG